MAITHPIPVDLLRQLLRLDPETGSLYWRERGAEWFRDSRRSAADECARWNTRYAGKEAFTSTDSRGYRHGLIFRRTYSAHRVVFALHWGRWPDGDTDHRDGNRSNNRPENLREATRAQNIQNSRRRAGGSSRFRGVWLNRSGRWQAECMKHYLGTFSDDVEAARAYDAAARGLQGEFARLNFPD